MWRTEITGIQYPIPAKGMALREFQKVLRLRETPAKGWPPRPMMWRTEITGIQYPIPAKGVALHEFQKV